MNLQIIWKILFWYCFVDFDILMKCSEVSWESVTVFSSVSNEVLVLVLEYILWIPCNIAFKFLFSSKYFWWCNSLLIFIRCNILFHFLEEFSVIWRSCMYVLCSYHIFAESVHNLNWFFMPFVIHGVYVSVYILSFW